MVLRGAGRGCSMLSVDARPPLQRHHGSDLGGSVLGPHDHIRVHLPIKNAAVASQMMHSVVLVSGLE